MKKQGFVLRVNFHGPEFQRNCSVSASPAHVLMSLDANWFVTPQMDESATDGTSKVLLKKGNCGSH